MNVVSRFLSKQEAYLLSNDHLNTYLLWFKKAAYIVLLCNMLSIFPNLDIFYQQATRVYTYAFYPDFKALILWPTLSAIYHYVWVVCCIVVGIAVCVKSRYWLSMLVFIISLNHFNLVYSIANGGDIILNFFIFILIFTNEGAKNGNVKQMPNTAAFYLILISTAAVYFVNGYGKILQPSWRDGSFLSGVWQLKYYANQALIPNWFNYTWLRLLTAWGVMSFELLFPFLLLFNGIRKWVILIGLIFHIFIGLFLSLLGFALVMMLPYVLLINGLKKPSSLKV